MPVENFQQLRGRRCGYVILDDFEERVVKAKEALTLMGRKKVAIAKRNENLDALRPKQRIK